MKCALWSLTAVLLVNVRLASGQEVSLPNLCAYMAAREQMLDGIDVQYEYTKKILPGYYKFVESMEKNHQLVNLGGAQAVNHPTLSKKGFNIDQDIIYKEAENKFYCCLDNLIPDKPTRQEYYYNGLFEWQYAHANNRVDIVGKPSTLPPLYHAVVFNLLKELEAPRDAAVRRLSQVLSDPASEVAIKSDGNSIVLQVAIKPDVPNAPPSARWVWNIKMDPKQYDISRIQFMGAQKSSAGLMCYDPDLIINYSNYDQFGSLRLPKAITVEEYVEQTDPLTGADNRYAAYESGFTLEKAALGAKIDDSQFKFNYAKGMTVVDQPAGKVYTVGDNLDDLSKDLQKYSK